MIIIIIIIKIIINHYLKSRLLSDNQQFKTCNHEMRVHVTTEVGFGRMEGGPCFLSNVIILLFLDLRLSTFRSRPYKKDDTFSFLQGSGRIMNDPSSSLSSLLINSSTTHSCHLALSLSDIVVDFCKVTFLNVSFYKKKRKTYKHRQYESSYFRISKKVIFSIVGLLQ